MHLGAPAPRRRAAPISRGTCCRAGGARRGAQLIREASKHVFTLKGCRMWLRSLVAS